MQSLTAYIPIDRRHALAQGKILPDRTTGAALFADISGFTPLTEALAAELGRKRGAEEVLRQINPVYEALIAELHRYGGSVIGFAGDAITCWLDDAIVPASPQAVASVRATACALAMQKVMGQFPVARTPTGTIIDLGIKVSVAAGPARRFVVGDPEIQTLDVLAGDILTRMAATEGFATTGEVLVSEEVATTLADNLQIAEWRQSTGDHRIAVVTQLLVSVPTVPWSSPDISRLTEKQLQTWVLPAVYRRLQAGEQFLGDLRPVTPLFLKFGGIDYDRDEAASEKLDAYIRWVQSVLERYEGSLLQLTLGDKGSFLHAAFGVLLAHENDTTRALMAALALQTPPPALSIIGPVQIGVTQGQVWTGAYGSPFRHTFGVIGNWVNMAARLMAKAKPGQVLVSQAAADLAQGRIRFRDLGAIRVKGRSTPLYVTEAVLVEKAGRHLSEQFERPMVGRDDELSQLLTLLDEVEAGASRVVTIEAEAGLGKSRLVAAWAAHVRQRGLRGYLGAAQSIEQHTSYRAWQDLLSTFLGLDELTTTAERQTQVESRVHALNPDAIVYMPLLNDILDDLAIPDNDLTQSLPPHGRQQALITFLLKIFQAAAVHSPLLLVLEDAHWLDAISWELSLQLARGLEVTRTPFLLILVTRPVADLPASTVALRRLPYSRYLSLTSLPPSAIKALVANHLGVLADDLPLELLKLIQSRAEGNPFFAEELLLNLQAHGVIAAKPDPVSGQPRCLLQKELDQVAVALPSSLQGVILARIDRLPPEQQLVLKLAAVIGRSFTYPPLRHLYQHYRVAQTVALAAEIAHLEERNFVSTDALEPELTYLFKHIVIREVVYDTLLYEQKRPLHRTVADWYERAYQGEIANSPYLPLLVHHTRQAEEIDMERRYIYLAGQQAAAHYANEDALAYFSRSLELTPTADMDGQYQVVWAREEIHARLGRRAAQAADLAHLTVLASTVERKTAVALRYGIYHINVGEYEAAIAISEQASQWAAECGDDASQAQAMINSGRAAMEQSDYEIAAKKYRQAYELAQTAPAQAARAWSGLGEVAFRQGDYPTAAHYHQQALDLRQELGDRQGQVQSLRNLGQVANAQGEYEAARNHYLQALQLAQQMGDRPYEGRLLLDLGESDWRQGAYPRAEMYLQQSLALAQSTGDKFTMAAAWKGLGAVAYFQGQYEQATDYWKQSMVLSQEIGDRAGANKTLNNLGAVAERQGQYDQAMSYYEQSLAVSQKIGDRAMESIALNNLGIVAYAQGQYSGAANYYQQSLVLFQEMGDRAGAGSTLNNLGTVAYAQGQYDWAIDYYEQSLVIRQEIGDRAGVGLTLNNLGQVAYAQGRYEQATDYYERGLVIFQEIGDRAVEGVTLNNLGTLALAQSAFHQAQNYYQQALTIRQELNQPHYLVDDWAGLALLAWQQNDLETAQAYIEPLLAAWAGNPTLEGAEHPMRDFHFTWQVCQALGLAQADEVLAKAAQVIQTYLDNQSNPAAKAIYLQQPHHQALWAAWQAQQKAM